MTTPKDSADGSNASVCSSCGAPLDARTKLQERLRKLKERAAKLTPITYAETVYELNIGRIYPEGIEP